MKILLCLRELGMPGGLQTFALTIADQLAPLGHEVVIYAPIQGLAAEFGRERGITIVSDQTSLPTEVDATLAFDRVMAIEMARLFPRARRLFGMHNADDFWLPPSEPGIVAVTVAPNDRLAMLARGCSGAGEVVRIRQPIDLYRFGPRGRARDKPVRILLLGNYSNLAHLGADQLRAAWSQPGLEWFQCGVPEPTMEVAAQIAKADIVVGYGRSIIEAMACGRPAYVHEHSGSDGWVTAETYGALEADGFSGIGGRPEPSFDQLKEDFLRYDPALGGIGHGLARTHHDARLVTAELVAIINGMEPPARTHDPQALAAMRNLSVLLYRANSIAQDLRMQIPFRRAEFERRYAALVDRHGREQRAHEEEKARLLEELRKATGPGRRVPRRRRP